MTGTEFDSLHEGDLCLLTDDIDTYSPVWHKGDVIEVVYRSRNNVDELYVRNMSQKYKDRHPYKTLGPVFLLNAAKLYKKREDIKNKVISTTFTHKFNVGDTFWAMYCNKPKAYKVEKVNYYIDKDNTEVEYITTDNHCFYDNSNTYDTGEIYATKDELLDGLR